MSPKGMPTIVYVGEKQMPSTFPIRLHPLSVCLYLTNLSLWTFRVLMTMHIKPWIPHPNLSFVNYDAYFLNIKISVTSMTTNIFNFLLRWSLLHWNKKWGSYDRTEWPFLHNENYSQNRESKSPNIKKGKSVEAETVIYSQLLSALVHEN